MQEQRTDNSWGEPQAMSDTSMPGALNRQDVRRVVCFMAKDERGRPSAEMRRAWRRFKGNR